MSYFLYVGIFEKRYFFFTLHNFVLALIYCGPEFFVINTYVFFEKNFTTYFYRFKYIMWGGCGWCDKSSK